MVASQDLVLKKPIIVIGAPRSGTTILGECFSVHRDLEYIEEPRLTWRYGNDDKSDRLLPDDARPEVREHIRLTFARRIIAGGKTRLLEKTPSNSLRLGFVDRVFPDCKFVHIRRNSVDSALSIRRFWLDHAKGIKPNKISERLRELNVKRVFYYGKEFLRRALPRRMFPFMGVPVWGPRIPGISALTQELDLLEVCCLQWRMCVESAAHYGRRLPADRYFECRLEDLSQDMLTTIMEFCELQEDEKVREYFDKSFDHSMAGARKQHATPEEIALIEEWVEATDCWLKVSGGSATRPTPQMA